MYVYLERGGRGEGALRRNIQEEQTKGYKLYITLALNRKIKRLMRSKYNNNESSTLSTYSIDRLIDHNRVSLWSQHTHYTYLTYKYIHNNYVITDDTMLTIMRRWLFYLPYLYIFICIIIHLILQLFIFIVYR